MVDLDSSYTGDDEGSSETKKKKKKKESSRGSSKSPDSSPEPVRSEVDIESRVKKANLSETSKEWAERYGDLSFEEGSSGSLKQYIKKQEKEADEFYDNLAEMGVEIASEGAQKFTLAHHAMILNMAHNRTGIKTVLEEDFGKSEGEAIKITNKICENAGEYEAFVRVMNKIAKDGLEVTDLESLM